MSDDGGGPGPAPCLAEGLLYRESTVVPGIVKRRFGVLLRCGWGGARRSEGARRR